MPEKYRPSPEKQPEQKEDKSSHIIWLLKIIFSNPERKRIHPSLAVCDSMNSRQLAKLVGIKSQEMLEALKTLPSIDPSISEDTKIGLHVLETLFPESIKPKKDIKKKERRTEERYREILEFVQENPEGVTAERIASACNLEIHQALTFLANLKRRSSRLVQELVGKRSGRGKRERIFKWRDTPKE